jgi:hypothetical protein
MAALTTATVRPEVLWDYKQFTLAAGNKCFQGGAIFFNPATGKCVSGANVAAAGLLFLGVATENVDATLADLLVNVNLIDELALRWWDNGAGADAVASTDAGSDCYALDDHSVSILAAGKSRLGRAWAVDAIKGVLVEKRTGAATALASTPAVPAYVANDGIPTTIVNGGIYDVPATGAASTITLPAAAADGTVAYFAADGTKNAHTVTYRDATGPVSLTTALTAAKRHLVVVAKLGGKWTANAYVSP